MRFLFVATIAALGLLAPTQAISVADKLRSLSQRIAAEADSLSESDSTITADALPNCHAEGLPHTCEAKGCTWFVHHGENKGSCILGHGMECSNYKAYTECEQHGNEDRCVWYHDNVHSHKPQCLDRSMVYQPYMIDCAGTHTKSGGFDSTLNRDQHDCQTKEPYKTYCVWNHDQCVNLPYGHNHAHHNQQTHHQDSHIGSHPQTSHPQTSHHDSLFDHIKHNGGQAPSHPQTTTHFEPHPGTIKKDVEPEAKKITENLKDEHIQNILEKIKNDAPIEHIKEDLEKLKHPDSIGEQIKKDFDKDVHKIENKFEEHKKGRKH